jgi:hypothetical protein
MQKIRTALFGLLVLLAIGSCEKDPVKLYDDYGNAEISSRNETTPERDTNLINSFYWSILEIQSRTQFYDDFHEEYGYFNWANTMEYEAGDGKILFVPVIKNNEASNRGGFLYYKDYGAQRIQFFDKLEIKTKFDATLEENLPTSEEKFIYKNLVINDIQRNIEDESNRFDVFFNTPPDNQGGGSGTVAGSGGPDDCEGGSFEYICGTSYDSEVEIANIIENYLNDLEDNVNYAQIFNDYNGWSFEELQSNYRQIAGGYLNVPNNALEAFNNYFQAREALSDIGYGNGPTGILGQAALSAVTDCAFVWVWCWQDPADFEVGLSGSGGGSTNNGDYRQPWHELYDKLRFCEGVDDVFDTGPDNPSSQHPDFDFCSTWIDYLEDCILPNEPFIADPGDFSNPNLTYVEIIEEWANFMYNSPDLFEQTISDSQNCISTSGIDDHIDNSIDDEVCANALAVFEATYGIDVGRLNYAILQPENGVNPPCSDEEAMDDWIKRRFLKFALQLSDDEIEFLNINNLQDLTFSLAITEEDPISSIAVKMMNEIDQNDLLNGPHDQTFTNTISPYLEEDFAPVVFTILLNVEIAVLKLEHQSCKSNCPSCECPDDWSDKQIYLQALYNVISEQLHYLLDGFGLVPGFGEVADLANGVIYTLEGQGTEAALSFAATIPFAGWYATGTKVAIKVTTQGGKKTTLKWIKDANGVIVFSKNAKSARYQLRRVLGIPKGNTDQAHHVLPWAKTKGHELVQHAAKGDGFHMNDLNNGIAVAAWRNQPNHHIYDDAVDLKLGEIRTFLENKFGTTVDLIHPNEVAAELGKFQAHLKNLIDANPNFHLDDLNQLISNYIPTP